MEETGNSLLNNISDHINLTKYSSKACEIPASQNEHSHYICDDDGDVKCLPGWQGDLCDVPICRKGCDPQQGNFLLFTVIKFYSTLFINK